MSKSHKRSKKKKKTARAAQVFQNTVSDVEESAEKPIAVSAEFDFGSANDEQRTAIRTTDGPVLITAGPGTGKTFTLVQRALYLIMNKGVKPEQILMSTFTEKAAKELVTRISNALAEKNIAVNINEMYIGTLHSICLRILKENLEYTRIKKNFRTLDDFDQKYLIFRNMYKFKAIPDFRLVFPKEREGDWVRALEICKFINNFTEELIDYEELISSDAPKDIAIGHILEIYQQLLQENNYLDFSGIQTEAYWLLKNNPDILKSIQDKIKYLMIDEYQDTNYIQELLVFMLAGANKNICVVGDDDQGLYRFRGATIRNILEFPQKFAENACTIIKLTENYRSNSDIVDFYNAWMQNTEFENRGFEWGSFRYDKTIVPHEKTKLSSPAVIRISSDDEDAWNARTLEFIKALLATGKIKDLNQIAFLFKSVKSDKVTALADYLEANGINVYSPRSAMFFDRYEVKMLIGCLLLCFSDFCYNIQERNFKYVNEELCRYYEGCLELVGEYLETPEGEPLAEKLGEIADRHSFLEKNTDYAFTGLAYQIFAYEPFASILNSDVASGVIDLRPARNIALMTSILAKFEYLHRVDVFSPKNIEKDVDRFFNLYLKLLKDGGIAEYEDEAEYAPNGCVSFLTIHQSKGMEFPVVVVGSLGNVPKNQNDEIISDISQKYYKRPAFEPQDTIKYYDFWRLYYTAFSRAQNLLVLSSNRSSRTPSLYFRETFDALPEFDAGNVDLAEFDYELIKETNLKETYSFTSHIAVYEECALQYKFFKELGFTPMRVGATIFGTIVHETIEDIHRAALRHEESLITPENIRQWLTINYATISKAEHAYLGQAQIEAAYNQVEAYAERQKDNWARIREAEVDVSLVKADYILEGKIDLIRADNDTVEVIDFKSEKRPTAEDEGRYTERYKKQLQVYAHLVEKRTGHKVSKMTLYFTGEDNTEPALTFQYDPEDISATVSEFDEIVHKIKHKEFGGRAKSAKTCSNCDFRYYCKKER